MASLHADHEHVHFACAYAAQTDLRRSSAVSSSATFLKACVSSSRAQLRKACRACDECLLVGFHVSSIQSKWGGAANFGSHAAALSLVIFMEPCKLVVDMRTLNLILTCRQPHSEAPETAFISYTFAINGVRTYWAQHPCHRDNNIIRNMPIPDLSD